MNIDEILILSKITKSGGNGYPGTKTAIREDDEVLYCRNGRFTICIIHTQDWEILAVGATKRHPKDLDKPGLARNIAFTRAVRDRGERDD